MDLRHVPVALVDVEAVPDHERGRDPKPDIPQVQVDLLEALFEEQRADPEGARPPGREIFAQVLQRQPRIDDVLDDQDITAGQVEIEVLAARVAATVVRSALAFAQTGGAPTVRARANAASNK